MKEYKELAANKAYRLLGHGPTALISTRSKDGKYDIAPVAWSCPLNDDPTRVIIVVDKNHKTAMNIRETGAFIFCVPHASQLKLVGETGSVSGKKADKFEKFKIAAEKGKKADALIPDGVIGYIECKVIQSVETEFADVIMGECLYAAADSKAFDERVLAEKEEGKTLHHLGGNDFVLPGKVVSLK